MFPLLGLLVWYGVLVPSLVGLVVFLFAKYSSSLILRKYLSIS